MIRVRNLSVYYIIVHFLIVTWTLSFSGTTQATLTIYTDETTYLSALDSLVPANHILVQEGFEDDAVWNAARSPAAADSVISRGVIWSSNHPDAVVQASEITTGQGPPFRGLWAAFASPHGNPDRNLVPDFCDVTPPPASCLTHDGLLATASTGATFYAVGVWVDGTFNSQLIALLGDNEADPIDFGTGGVLSGIEHQFIGLIETSGFSKFEFREIEGKTGDEKLVFFDEFSIAGDFPATPNISISTPDINFGNVTVGASTNQVVTISNYGNADLLIGNIAQTDLLAAPFSLESEQDNCSNQIVVASANCTISVSFLPTSDAVFNDSFDVPSNDPDSASINVSVTGTGILPPTPEISVSSTNLDFGTVTVGSSDTQTVTISNTGNADLILGELAQADLLATPYAIFTEQDNCSNQTLLAAASCTVEVSFTPETDSIFNDSFDVPSNDPDTTSITVSVTGTGTLSPTPNISLSSASLDFGTVVVGDNSSQTITISNNGNANLILGEIAQTDPLVLPFSIITAQDNCSNQSLAASASCTLTVSFTPDSNVLSIDSFDVPSNDPDTPTLTISTSGTGIEASAPDITLSSNSFDYGTVSVGDGSNQILTITNSGNADLLIIDIAQANPLTSPYSFVAGQDGCSNQLLLPLASCNINIRFEPSGSGVFNDSFDIPSNDPDSPSLVVEVIGIGAVSPTPDISLSETSLSFGSVTIGNNSIQNLVITNNGNADLTLGNMAQIDPIAEPFSILASEDNCSNQVLLPLTSCSLNITFAPSGSGSFNDGFDVPSDDPDTPSLTVSISGTGTAPPIPNINLSATSIIFGSITVGLSAEFSITITNSGNAELTIGEIAKANPLVTPYELNTADDHCSSTILIPGNSCSIIIRFVPEAVAISNDSFDLPSNDPDTPSITINVSGTGTEALIPKINLTTNNIDFGNVTLDQSSEFILSIENTGSADLNLGVIASNNPLALPFELIAVEDNCSEQILIPAADCNLLVRFTPSSEDTFNDSFDISSNDPDTPSVLVNVSGTGISALSNNPPSPPSLVFPANAQANLSTSITFRWMQSSDSDGDIISYNFFYCENEDFSGCDGIDVVTFAVVSNGFLTMHTGTIGIAALVLFVTLGNRKRRSNILLAATAISLIAISSCGGGSGGDNNGTGNIVGNGGSGTGTGSGNSNEITFDVTGLDPNTTYYWKAVATDGQDTTESATWTFSTQ